jgi:hypothetical protein
VPYFKVLSRHLPGGTEENYEKTHSQDSWSTARDLKPGPPEYEAGVIITLDPWKLMPLNASFQMTREIQLVNVKKQEGR